MKNKLITYSTALVVSIASGGAVAGHEYDDINNGHQFTDHAKVIHATPIVRMVRVEEPREVCNNDDYTSTYYDDDGYESATPMIAGGVIGGILGNQFGKGRGKTVMTVAGAVLGGSLGRDYGHKSRHVSRKSGYYCETVTDYREVEKIEGYRVAYRYKGQRFNTTLPYDPGKRLRVNVSVTPAQ